MVTILSLSSTFPAIIRLRRRRGVTVKKAGENLKGRLRLNSDLAPRQTDKVGKAFKYLEAALAFIECGIAVESESPASRSAYSIYSETLDLIK